MPDPAPPAGGPLPDSLQLTKPQVITVLNAVIARWKRNKRKNAVHIVGANAFKLGILATPDNVFHQLWHALISFSNELLAYNEMMRLKREAPRTSDMVAMFVRKVESGEFLQDIPDVE